MASIDGKRLEFKPGGLRNATMIAEDKETGSLWYSPNGMAVTGPYKGKYLPSVPSFHLSFAEWLELHPDTDVMAPPDDPIRRDIRYGHGTFEAIGRPGIARHMATRTLTFPVDYRLPENTLVMGVTCGSKSRVYPLQDVRKEGSVVHDELDGIPIMVIAGPYAHSSALAAYSRRLGDQVLEFSYDEPAGQYVDSQTGSRWNIEGKALAGPFAGSALEPLDSCYIRWHGWGFGHKQTDLYSSKATPVVNPGPFAELIAALESFSYLIEIESVIMHLCLPNEATYGLTLHINGDRFNLYTFSTSAAAEDYVFAKAHTLRAGKLVVESNPDDRLKFADKLFTSRRPEEKIPWSCMVNPDNVAGEQFINDFRRAAGNHKDEDGELKRVFQALTAKGYEPAPQVDRADAIDRGIMAEAYRFQLPMHALNARPFNIGKDPLMLYKFAREEDAARYVASIARTLQAGRFVLRSTPRDMYYDAGFGEKPEDEVSWSKLLEEARFIKDFGEACKGV